MFTCSLIRTMAAKPFQNHFSRVFFYRNLKETCGELKKYYCVMCTFAANWIAMKTRHRSIALVYLIYYCVIGQMIYAQMNNTYYSIAWSNLWIKKNSIIINIIFRVYYVWVWDGMSGDSYKWYSFRRRAHCRIRNASQSENRIQINVDKRWMLSTSAVRLDSIPADGKIIK